MTNSHLVSRFSGGNGLRSGTFFPT